MACMIAKKKEQKRGTIALPAKYNQQDCTLLWLFHA
jgi:hypothetical protein